MKGGRCSARVVVQTDCIEPCEFKRLQDEDYGSDYERRFGHQFERQEERHRDEETDGRGTALHVDV